LTNQGVDNYEHSIPEREVELRKQIITPASSIFGDEFVRDLVLSNISSEEYESLFELWNIMEMELLFFDSLNTKVNVGVRDKKTGDVKTVEVFEKELITPRVKDDYCRVFFMALNLLRSKDAFQIKELFKNRDEVSYNLPSAAKKTLRDLVPKKKKKNNFGGGF